MLGAEHPRVLARGMPILLWTNSNSYLTSNPRQLRLAGESEVLAQKTHSD
jgi:hypothetical protein